MLCLFMATVAAAAWCAPAAGAEYWFPVGDGVGRPVAARNNDGRLELLVRRSDGAIWHRWQDATAPDGYSAWLSLGGSFSSDPVIAKAADGHLEVFVRTSAGAINQKWRSGAAAEGSWSANWTQIATGIAGDPVVVQNSASRLEVFARASDASVGYTAQTNSTPGGPWSAWTSLGGFVSSDPAVAANADGRLEVFVRTPDGIVWNKWQTTAGGTWSAFWSSLGGATAGNPAVARNADGRLELFAITGTGRLWHRHQATVGASATWSTEQFLGGDVAGGLVGTSGNLIGNPALAFGDGGRLGIIARAGNGRVWSKWQKTAGVDTWSVWSSTCGSTASDPFAAPPSSGSPELYVRTGDNTLWHKRCDEQCLGLEGKTVPVLIYHAFSEADPTWGEPGLFVKPSELQLQLNHLTSNGFTPVQVADLENLCVVDKPVMITVDDGYRDNWTDLYPKLQAANAKAVIFSISNAIDAALYLTEQQMLDMRPLVSFQNHTANHPDLTTLSTSAVRSEMTTATSRLQTLTGQTVLALAYPYGGQNATINGITREYFRYGFSTVDGVYRLGQDRYTVPRIFVGRSDTLSSFVEKLRTCAHSEYATGVKLKSDCGGSCVATVCAGQPSCCSTSWDQLCVDAARVQCDVDTP